MKPQHLSTLLAIADHGIRKEIQLTTQILAKQLGISQQSASRLLQELAREKLIIRTVRKQGQILCLTLQGKRALEELQNRLSTAFASKEKQLIGTVKSGLGEGAYYMKLEGYRKQFKRRVGYAPYPGTLNLSVTQQEGESFSRDPRFFNVEGFKAKGRSFGGLRGKRCIIRAGMIRAGNKKTEAIAIVPDRTSHGTDTIEIIAKMNLRKLLSLKDGSRVVVEY